MKTELTFHKSRLWWVFAALGIVALDYGSKLLAVRYLKPIDTLPLWQNVFHLTYCENTGAAFSLFADGGVLLIAVTALAMAGLLYLLLFMPYENKVLLASLAMLLGGGIGNLIDRVRLSYVIDFFDFRLIHFAVFNVADCFVTVGAFMLILYLLCKQEKKDESKEK